MLELQSLHSNEKISLQAYILPVLTAHLPSFSLKDPHWPHLDGLQLADPDFLTPGPVDMVLGASPTGLIINTDVIKGPSDLLSLNPLSLAGLFLEQPTRLVQLLSHMCTTSPLTRNFMIYSRSSGPKNSRLPILFNRAVQMTKIVKNISSVHTPETLQVAMLCDYLSKLPLINSVTRYLPLITVFSVHLNASPLTPPSVLSTTTS